MVAQWQCCSSVSGQMRAQTSVINYAYNHLCCASTWYLWSQICAKNELQVNKINKSTSALREPLAVIEVDR